MEDGQRARFRGGRFVIMFLFLYSDSPESEGDS